MFKHVQTTLLLGTETHEQGYILINIEALFQILTAWLPTSVPWCPNLPCGACHPTQPAWNMVYRDFPKLPKYSKPYSCFRPVTCFPVQKKSTVRNKNPHGLPQSSKWSWRHRCNPRTWEFQGFAAQYELPEEWKKQLCIFSTEPSTLTLWPLF